VKEGGRLGSFWWN